jgi:hypothetical protein
VVSHLTLLAETLHSSHYAARPPSPLEPAAAAQILELHFAAAFASSPPLPLAMYSGAKREIRGETASIGPRKTENIKFLTKQSAGSRNKRGSAAVKP